MIGERVTPSSISRYEWLLRLSEHGRVALLSAARPVHAAPGLLRQEGDACDAVTLLTHGCVRVSKRRASGRSLTLYTVEPGGLCVLEMLGVLTRAPFRAEAYVEQPVDALVLPGDRFRDAVATEPALRDAVFQVFEARLAATLELVADVALATLEARLAGTLLRHARAGTLVRRTHEQLAQEVACGREAVSRILEHWEQLGHVRLGRGHIRVDVPTRLARLAEDAET